MNKKYEMHFLVHHVLFQFVYNQQKRIEKMAEWLKFNYSYT